MSAILEKKQNADVTVSQATKLRDLIEDDIVNGIYKPGEKLDETALAERFKVSRTPIREAFGTLAGTGLVETIPNRGTFVANISITRLVEMFEVMAELESMCARLAARRITNDESNELQRLLDACSVAEKSRNSDAYYYENQLFHDLIYRASHNSFLVQQTRNLQVRLKPYRRSQLRLRNHAATSMEEHRKIVAAILAGDEAAAESSMKGHVKIQGERFTDFVATLGREIG